MLVESRLYSFLDPKLGYNLHFLEGQKLISDLSILHNLNGPALNYYRDTILSSVHLINFLKAGEGLGFYIDSEDPYFRFKVELNYDGKLRTLMLPTELQYIPSTLTGMARLSKVFQSAGNSYTSHIELKDLSTSEIVNQIFQNSYQVNCKTFIALNTDQSILISKLPALNVNIENNELPLNELSQKLTPFINKIFQNNFSDIERLVPFIEKNDLTYIGSKQIQLSCPCSKERMMTNLYNLNNQDLNHIFEEQSFVEIKCDYCKSVYQIKKSDFENLL
jgi:molecular chaperone Hsp33